MRKFKKVLPAILLSCILLMATISPVTALESPSEKEEVIYINLTADGSIKDVYAVNIFGSGDIIDYGNYSSIEMLNTTDKVSQNGEQIAFSTSADRVYYKGIMNNTEIPWNISIKYYIDGTLIEEKTEIKEISLTKKIEWEVTGTDIHTYSVVVTCMATGKSGVLYKMEVDFTKNPPTKDHHDTFNAKIFQELAE